MSEIASLADAVAGTVHDGDTVALEGFTHLIPFAAGHEVLRQGRRDLTLVRLTPDVLYDQMIGMGAARRLVFSWGGNPGVGSLHRFRDAIEHGWPHPIELEEHSHAGMANRYVAGASGCPSPCSAATRAPTCPTTPPTSPRSTARSPARR
jgi:glutaconate CoA-transferase subunit A